MELTGASESLARSVYMFLEVTAAREDYAEQAEASRTGPLTHRPAIENQSKRAPQLDI